MARTVKPAEHEAKRNEILDAAAGLVYSKGYEKMTIQDLLDTLRISRGALYHYFVSKQQLVEALIERSAGDMERSLLAIVQDPGLSAVEKIQGYFDIATRWKTSQKDLIMGALRSWYSDDNVLLRQKLGEKSRRYVSRLLEPIIHQGVQEGLFATPYPAEIAAIFAGMTLNLSDCLVELMLAEPPEPGTLRRAQALLDAYTVSIERILGAGAGSFRPVNFGVFKDWFSPERG
ncbi:MAG TPA: TetR/AcrR family transcriptional regulator [Spirochaetia bacterium]|nr:TetR/AcrR family transcriptional regulator [Spirochaetia bacterium]